VTTFESDKIETLSAVLAMGMILNKLGKNFYIFTPETPKVNFSFLPSNSLMSSEISGNNLLILVAEDKSKLKKMLWEKKDGFLRLEVVSKNEPFTPQDVSFTYQKPQIDYLLVLGSPRFGANEKLAKFKDRPVINIDYHKDNNSFGKYNWLDERAYSLVEMLVSLVEALEMGSQKEIKDKDIATLLYAAILWRSKGLIGKVPSKIFSVVAQLLSWGAKKNKIDRYFWQVLPAETLTLLGALLESVEYQNGYFIFSFDYSQWSEKKKLMLNNIDLIINEIKQKTAGLVGLVLVLEDEKHKGLVWASLDEKKIADLATFIDWQMQTKNLSQGQTLNGFSEAKIKIKQILF
jgi:hypothetical protein